MVSLFIKETGCFPHHHSPLHCLNSKFPFLYFSNLWIVWNLLSFIIYGEDLYIVFYYTTTVITRHGKFGISLCAYMCIDFWISPIDWPCFPCRGLKGSQYYKGGGIPCRCGIYNKRDCFLAWFIGGQRYCCNTWKVVHYLNILLWWVC